MDPLENCEIIQIYLLSLVIRSIISQLMRIILELTVNVITAIIVANEFYIIAPKPVNVKLRLHCVPLNSSITDGTLAVLGVNKRRIPAARNNLFFSRVSS